VFRRQTQKFVKLLMTVGTQSKDCRALMVGLDASKTSILYKLKLGTWV